MLDATDLPASRIKLHPANKGSPSDLKPTAHGWPVKESDKPVITLNLASLDGKHPGVLKKFNIHDNVKTVLIKYTTEHHQDSHIDPTHKHVEPVFHEYNQGKPVTVRNGEVDFPGGLTAHQVQFTLVEPIHQDKPYDVKLTVHACLHGMYTIKLYFKTAISGSALLSVIQYDRLHDISYLYIFFLANDHNIYHFVC